MQSKTAFSDKGAQIFLSLESYLKLVREDLIRRGIEVNEPFHDTGGIFWRNAVTAVIGGAAANRDSSVFSRKARTPR